MNEFVAVISLGMLYSIFLGGALQYILLQILTFIGHFAWFTYACWYGSTISSPVDLSLCVAPFDMWDAALIGMGKVAGGWVLLMFVRMIFQPFLKVRE